MKFRTVTGLAVIAVIWKKKKKSAPFAMAMAKNQLRKRMTPNQEMQYLKRILRLCAAHKANPNQQKNEVDEIRVIVQRIIEHKDVQRIERFNEVKGTPV
jgi:hypothetical protein